MENDDIDDNEIHNLTVNKLQDIHEYTNDKNDHKINEFNFKGVVIGGTYQHCFDENLPLIAPPLKKDKRVTGVNITKNNQLEIKLYIPNDETVKIINLGTSWIWMNTSPDGFLVSKNSFTSKKKLICYYLQRHPIDWARDTEREERENLRENNHNLMVNKLSGSQENLAGDAFHRFHSYSIDFLDRDERERGRDGLQRVMNSSVNAVVRDEGGRDERGERGERVGRDRMRGMGDIGGMSGMTMRGRIDEEEEESDIHYVDVAMQCEYEEDETALDFDMSNKRETNSTVHNWSSQNHNNENRENENRENLENRIRGNENSDFECKKNSKYFHDNRVVQGHFSPPRYGEEISV